MIQPLYAARVGEMDPGELIRAQCTACGRIGLLEPRRLLDHPRIQTYTRVVDLKFHLKCSGCGAGRHALEVTIQRAG